MYAANLNAISPLIGRRFYKKPIQLKRVVKKLKQASKSIFNQQNRNHIVLSLLIDINRL